MQRFMMLCLLTALLLAGMQVFAQGRAYIGQHEVEADGLLIKLKPGVSDTAIDAVNAKIGGRTERKFARTRWQHVKLRAGMRVQDAIARYKGAAEVLTVEPNYIYHTDATANDPRMSSLWGITKIQAPTAWDTSTGNANLVVAVLDTGVDYNHEDLRANMWKNPREVAGNGIDDDGNGYVDDIYGIDTYNKDSDPKDDKGHGTHVAGTIGAVGNNSLGVAGINWSVKIMALKFMGADGTGSTSGAVAAYEYLVNMKSRGVNVRVVNNSWGGSGYSTALNDAINAASAAGIVSACAAGNGGSDSLGDNNDSTRYYPASYTSTGVIAVAASDKIDNPASFSNYGATSVHLAAPGVSIVSTYPGTSTYATMSGTSMATPHVAGAAALVLAVNPSLTASGVRAVLMNSVDKLTQWSGKVASGGRLNVAKALQNAGGVTPPPTPVNTYRPDLLIGLNASALTGDNVYSLGSDQTATQSVAIGTPAVYQLRVQNDGDTADTLTVTGPAGASGWTVRYFDAEIGGVDITSQVTGTGWKTLSLAAGATKALRVEVVPGSTVSGGTTREVAVKVTSTGDATSTDTVKAITTTKTTTTKVTAVTVAVNPTSPQPVNTSIAITGSATGAQAEYQFRVAYLSGSTWVWSTLRAYGTTPSVTWQPAQAGSYQLRVFARALGSTVSYDTYATVAYTIASATTGKLTGLTTTISPASPQRVNTQVTISATATGGQAEYQFRVGYYTGSGWAWTTLRNYSTTSSVTWQPTVARTYYIRVFARALGSTSSYDLYRTVSYTVTQ